MSSVSRPPGGLPRRAARRSPAVAARTSHVAHERPARKAKKGPRVRQTAAPAAATPATPSPWDWPTWVDCPLELVDLDAFRSDGSAVDPTDPDCGLARWGCEL